MGRQMSETRNRFCIVTQPRSGSRLLVDLLNATQAVNTAGELFLDWRAVQAGQMQSNGEPERFRTYKVDGKAPRGAFRRYFDYLDQFYPSGSPYGFKVMLVQLAEHPQAVRYLLSRRYKLIFLVRKNVFQLCVSNMLMEKTAVAHSRQESRIDPISLDPEELLRRMTKKSLANQVLRLFSVCAPAPKMWLTYEDLAENPQRCISEILGFLKAANDAGPANSSLKKRVNQPYSEIISNYEEVSSRLERSRFRKFLPTGNG